MAKSPSKKRSRELNKDKSETTRSIRVALKPAVLAVKQNRRGPKRGKTEDNLKNSEAISSVQVKPQQLITEPTISKRGRKRKNPGTIIENPHTSKGNEIIENCKIGLSPSRSPSNKDSINKYTTTWDKEIIDHIPNDVAIIRSTPTKLKVMSSTSKDARMMKAEGSPPVSSEENNDHNFLLKEDESYNLVNNDLRRIDSEPTDVKENENKEDIKDEKDRFNTMEIDSLIIRNLNKSPSSSSADSAKGSSLDYDIDLPIPNVGDLFWGRMFNFPFWACIVTEDPEGKTISMPSNKVRRQQLKVHVKFFADNGRRNWVQLPHLIPYKGKEDFLKIKKNILEKCKKKDRISKAFTVSEKKITLWEQAIEEADTVAVIDDNQSRIAKFNEIVEKARAQLNENRKNGSHISYIRKRSFSPDSSEIGNSTSKKIKSSSENSAKSYQDEIMLPSSIGEGLLSKDFQTAEDFQTFNNILKSFALVSTNSELEKFLLECSKQIWCLRKISEIENGIKNDQLQIKFHLRHLSTKMKQVTRKVNNDFQRNLFLQRKNQLAADHAEMKSKHLRSKPLEEVVNEIVELNKNKNYLFKGLLKMAVCKFCYEPLTTGEEVKCAGICQTIIHSKCASARSSQNGKMDKHPSTFYCKDCTLGENSKCFACKENYPTVTGEIYRCQVSHCRQYFHKECLRNWPQAKLIKSSSRIENFFCPSHTCHTCVSDDPRGRSAQQDRFKLIKCVKCPATYHSDSFCIPAGSKFITASCIVCPRHGLLDKTDMINANWCFICATGGSLVCCETCPMSFHLECLKISKPEENYSCEECVTGRLPLYGELVWAKLGSYRWWPALIIPPPLVPKNLQRRKRNENDFCIRFLGSNDHAWINRSRVYLYQEGDWGRVNQVKSIDNAYKTGLEEAKQVLELLKLIKTEKDSRNRGKLHPPAYIKIKTNRPVLPVKLTENGLRHSTSCECDPNDVQPCGPNSDCINRLLLTECNPKICPAGVNCCNQMFERKNYPTLKVLHTDYKGWGLFCDEDIPAGTFIIEYVGEVIDDAEFQRRILEKQKEKDENYYFLTLEKDYVIDAGPKGNVARFMNHSCDPNCETQKWNVNGMTRVGVFAIKNISAGNELTFDYNLECIGDEKKICHCGTTKCKGFLGTTSRGKTGKMSNSNQ